MGFTALQTYAISGYFIVFADLKKQKSHRF
jgi:hypothetical protein